MKWRDAVWAAVQREADPTTGEFTRKRLLEHQLGWIVSRTDSGGATPSQTLSRELQDLRNAGAILFLRPGVYRLATLTKAAATFAEAVATQRQALVNARVGQSPFRRKLMDRFGRACPVTGVDHPSLLRASHIIPWAACRHEADRLDPDNGLLLSAHWDSAFDRGLVSFDDRGRALASRCLSAPTAKALGLSGTLPTVPLTDGNRARLAWHRHRHAAADLVPVHS